MWHYITQYWKQTYVTFVYSSPVTVSFLPLILIAWVRNMSCSTFIITHVYVSWPGTSLPQVIHFLTHWSWKLVWKILKNSVRTAKKAQHFTVTKINWLTLFKEINYVNHKKPVTIKCSVIDSYRRWYMPLVFKGSVAMLSGLEMKTKWLRSRWLSLMIYLRTFAIAQITLPLPSKLVLRQT
jgi:hypothetical protein